MPELPEVQTIADDLNKKIRGDAITGFWTDWKKSVKMSLDKFKKEIKNRKIVNAFRIGKNLFLELSGGKTLYIHLKMTGHLLVKTQIAKRKAQNSGKNFFDEKVNQYIHHIFYLKSGRTLEFSDLRKFGKIIIEDTDKIGEMREIRELGMDAMSSEFTLKKLDEILNKKTTKIKLLLMDQFKIAGIGNIYASEILFEAGILPVRSAYKIKSGERQELFLAIRKILKKAIEMRGTSDSDYRDTDGAPGEFQKVLRVYRRAGKKCPKCGTIIQRIKLGQRGTFFCSKCQK